MSGEYQGEFFGEFKEEKGKFRKIADKITKRQQKLYLHLPLENVVLASIVIIMCVIIAFALGVERGKRLAASPKEDMVLEEKIILPEIEIKAEEVVLEEEAKEVKETEIKEEAKPLKKAYTIQLVSYKQKKMAEKEKNKLASKKIDAFILSSGAWFQVCAGNYKNTDQAKKALESFKKDYKGCFIRNK